MHEKITLAREFRPDYAIVEFDSVEARVRATKRSVALFGILFRDEMPTSAKRGVKVAGRSAFPQDVRLKRTLLLRGVPWICPPCEILWACAKQLGGQSALRHVNSGVFSADRTQ